MPVPLRDSCAGAVAAVYEGGESVGELAGSEFCRGGRRGGRFGFGCRFLFCAADTISVPALCGSFGGFFVSVLVVVVFVRCGNGGGAFFG